MVDQIKQTCKNDFHVFITTIEATYLYCDKENHQRCYYHWVEISEEIIKDLTPVIHKALRIQDIIIQVLMHLFGKQQLSSSIQKAHKGNVTQDNKPIQTKINKTCQWLTLNQINNLEPKI